MNIVPICSQDALAHPRVARKIRDRDSLQPQRPRSEQVKAAVPREIVNACGGFEEDDGLSLRGRQVTSYKSRHARDLEIVESTDESAFEALGEEFGESIHGLLIFDQLYSRLLYGNNP